MRFVLVCACVFMLAASLPVMADTVVVTSPAGVYTNTTSTEYSDTLAADTWLRRNVRIGASVGITNDYARSGNGSAWFKGTIGPSGSPTSKADMEYFFGDTSDKTLSSMSALSYDWYRSSASSAEVHLHPALRLMLDMDGSMSTTADRGYLVFEHAYNPATTPVPTDTWVSDNVLDFYGTGSSAKMWGTHSLSSVFSGYQYQYDLDDWITALPDAKVLGISSGIGSGWASFEGAVDNITIGFDGESTTFNFETQSQPAVPEPMSIMLGIIGLGSVAGFKRFRRK